MCSQGCILEITVENILLKDGVVSTYFYMWRECPVITEFWTYVFQIYVYVVGKDLGNLCCEESVGNCERYKIAF